MVIQRWQTVFLFIAAVMMGIFCFSTAAVYHVGGAVKEFQPSDAPVFFIVNIVITILLVISIFLYHNLSRQMRVTLISIMLMIVSMACGGFIIYGGNDGCAEVMLTATDLLLPCAIVLAVIAYRRMRHDKRLLTSSDRIR